MRTFDPNEKDRRKPSSKVFDINKRLGEMPRLRKQEEDYAPHTPDTLDKQLERIARTEDTLIALRDEQLRLEGK